MKKLTEKEKQAKDDARTDWNNQCKSFMMYSTPFKDKTAKECYLRHLEYLSM